MPRDVWMNHQPKELERLLEYAAKPPRRLRQWSVRIVASSPDLEAPVVVTETRVAYAAVPSRVEANEFSSHFHIAFSPFVHNLYASGGAFQPPHQGVNYHTKDVSLYYVSFFTCTRASLGYLIERSYSFPQTVPMLVTWTQSDWSKSHVTNEVVPYVDFSFSVTTDDRFSGHLHETSLELFPRTLIRCSS